MANKLLPIAILSLGVIFATSGTAPAAVRRSPSTTPPPTVITEVVIKPVISPM